MPFSMENEVVSPINKFKMKNKFTLIFIAIFSITLMSSIVDLNNLFNYENQDTPTYIFKDNASQDNLITDAGAALGRVLFYDKNLSINNTIACASCHLQEFAFGDTAVVSTGVNGVTGRHSMRLVNARFSDETNAFWDERASSFEDQATQPIQDHVEMGYSGENGDPGFDTLIDKLETIDYYQVLFEFVFGDSEITEARIQKAIAQFIRSMESFDSKFDEGRAQVNNNTSNFPNFTTQENEGKDLFFTPPPLGGAGCFRCHGSAEFSLIPNCNNNGVIGVANDPSAIDLTNTKSPSLRNLVNPAGMVNGPFMHDGSLATLQDVLDHYNNLEEVPENTNLDFRLAGPMHDLDLTQYEMDAIIAFLHTLTGVEIYTAEKWSNPFDDQGNITVVPLEPNSTINLGNSFHVELFPNPTADKLTIRLKERVYQLSILDMNGVKVKSLLIQENHVEDLSHLPKGVFIFQIFDLYTQKIYSKKVIKE